MRTQIPGKQILDQTIETEDLDDLAVTDAKLSFTGVSDGSYTKVSVNSKGRVLAGSNPSSLADAGIVVALDDLEDVALNSPLTNQILKFDGVNWVNAAAQDVDGSLKFYSENFQGGVPSEAAGFNSVALGSGAAAGSSNSIAIGDQSLSRLDGSMMFSSGRFASQGDAQSGKYLMRTHTINAFATELFLNGTAGNERLALSDDTTWVFEATIVGHQQDGDGHAGFRVKGVIYKSGAVNTSILGSVSKEVIAAHSGWDVAVTADNTNGSLKITATGEAGKIIRWLATISTIEVSN